MLTLYDYLPSQNAWKVRQILHHLCVDYAVELVSIFEGEGQTAEYRQINPWGSVPAIRLDDGRVLSESNAILWFLSAGTTYRPRDTFDDAKVLQWLSFEADYIQTSVGSLRYWCLTGKLSARPEEVVSAKRSIAARALSILDEQLSDRAFIAGDEYSIADISLFAYAHAAEDAGLSTSELPAFRRWVADVQSQDRFLSQMYPYSMDTHSGDELP